MRLPILLLLLVPCTAQTVFVSRMWHNHQPLYWPEWNTNGTHAHRIEYAWDSISLKPLRSYTGSTARHPENDLVNIFGLDDRRNAYQARPKDSLASSHAEGGFCLSYSGSLIDNVRQLGGGGHLGYSSGWSDGNRTARNWTTSSGHRRLDLVGFTYHHSLAPLIPKEVLRKEIQIFKQAYWKAWAGNPDLSDHSKGFFPTEMAFSRHIVDVLVDEGYEWAIVASHHLSRTCPTYFDQFDLLNANYGIFSSPPNRADLLGPSPTSGWWYAEPNPGNAAWNVAPFAYQLHKVEYVNPETGAIKSMITVPSDDVLSYRYGYSDEGVGKINDHIAPHATDPARPALVMPSTDGDNAWGGGFSSWMEATPRFFNSGYQPTPVQKFVDDHGAAADTIHIEDGAWIFPESDYGSPYFLKWIEPPVAAIPANRFANTLIDMETPGFALKFWSWAPIITGANWCETAEQILEDEGGSVEAWKIQAPYDWDGTDTEANDVELAWHIYLGGLDSGFNYYGGLGNDDEVKPGLATTRAIEKLTPWMTPGRISNDRTGPSILKPQRFPYNPGGYTFGWFNSIPGGDTNYLKSMPSEFYIWTHAYDIAGINSVTLKVRFDTDGINSLSTIENETFAGGTGVGSWISLPMTRRELPNDQAELNTAANNGQINYFINPPELADYYFAKIDDTTLTGFRGKLLDYYIEAVDELGNTRSSEIQHVFVEDDGGGIPVDAPDSPTGLVVSATTPTTVEIDWDDMPRASSYTILRNGLEIGVSKNSRWFDSALTPSTNYHYQITALNSGGSSPPSTGVTATTSAQTASIPFVLDGIADSPGYLLSNPGMTIYAALRGTTLYLATWAPGSFTNDHFLCLGRSLKPTPTTPAPWAKSGTTSLPEDSPFVGAEAENDYIGWFNTKGAATEVTRGNPGGQMEATIDLESAMETLPETLHLAALAYQSPDGGILGSQAPAPIINDNNVNPNEYLSIPLAALRDEDANGIYDRLDPNFDFVVTSTERTPSGLKLTWNCFPGRRYQIQSAPDLESTSWSILPQSTVTADSDALSLSSVVRLDQATRFFRVELLPESP